MRKREKKTTDKEGERTKTDWQCERERENSDREKSHWQRDKKSPTMRKTLTKRGKT